MQVVCELKGFKQNKDKFLLKLSGNNSIESIDNSAGKYFPKKDKNQWNVN